MTTSTRPLSLLQTVFGQNARFMFVNLHLSCSAPDLRQFFKYIFGPIFTHQTYDGDENAKDNDPILNLILDPDAGVQAQFASG